MALFLVDSFLIILLIILKILLLEVCFDGVSIKQLGIGNFINGNSFFFQTKLND